MILLDTNILTVSKQSAHRDYLKVTKLLEQLVADNEELVICPQNLYEFFVACTRPTASRGLGLTRQKTLLEMKNLKETYSFLNDPEDLHTAWMEVIDKYDTSGKQGHDARLVAFMKSTGINRFFTLNLSDFNRYSDIVTLIV